mmetsp:Transcript_5368/g.4548  ORF Transcript_5368/g.4548 Transcript_5368/m.4548 type:complete len:249 (-) Transcript_5368:906-1652(-)
MINDISTKDEISGGAQGKLSITFKSIIKMIFGRTSGSSIPASSEISWTEAHFLKMIFKYFDGPKILNSIFELIEEYSREYNSKQKQIVVSYIFFGIMKTFKYYPEGDEKQKIIKRIAKLFVSVMENISIESLAIWLGVFMNSFKNDYKIMKPFLDEILTIPFTDKFSSIQSRFLAMQTQAVAEYGPRIKDIGEHILKFILSYEPKDIRMATEFPQNNWAFIKYYLNVFVNYRKLKEDNIVPDLEQTLK